MAASGFGAGGSPGGGGGFRRWVPRRGAGSRTSAISETCSADCSGEGRRGGGRSRPAGRTSRPTVTVSFDEAMTGTTCRLGSRARRRARPVTGLGRRAGHEPDDCPRVRRDRRVAVNQGLFQMSQTCPVCHGSGRVVETPCPTCGGIGDAASHAELPGEDPGRRAGRRPDPARGPGEPGPAGGQPGDLYVRVRVQPHPIFGRSGNDLTLELPVTYAEAALGANVRVPTLNGPVTMKVPAGHRPTARPSG